MTLRDHPEDLPVNSAKGLLIVDETFTHAEMSSKFLLHSVSKDKGRLYHSDSLLKSSFNQHLAQQFVIETTDTKKICRHSLVILKLDLELIATESPFAPNNYLSDPNQHIKSLSKSTRRKIVNLPEHFQLICIISKGLLVCGFWNVKKAQVKINVMN